MSRSLNYQSVTIRFADWRKRTASALVKVLALTLLGAMPVVVVTSAPVAHAAASYTSGNLTCDTTGVDAIRVTPSHGKAFYVDGTGTTDATDIDATYIGYRIGNTGATKTNVWVKIDNFTSTTSAKSGAATDPTIVPVAGSSDVLQIANSIDSLTATDTRTAFFLLKATGVNAWGNSSEATGTYSHTVTVYDGNPSLSGATVLRTCTYTFTKIFNATAAAANKVTSITLSKTQPKLGETVTVTVAGQTGTIGSGTKSPDLDSIWLTAAPYSSFPVNSLRLTRTSFTGTGAGCSSAIVNQLLITNASATATKCEGNYTAVYTFTVIGAGSASQIVAPIAEIASGTEIKHTGVVTKTIDLSKATASSIQVQKGIITPDGVTDSVTVGSTQYAFVQYIETVTVSGTGASGSIDYLVDSPTAGTIMETTTSRLKTAPTYQIGLSGSAVTIIPTYSSGQYYFEGPFSFTNSNPLIIKYWMMLPIVSGSTTPYRNTAFAYLGAQKITASAGISLATVNVSTTGGVAGTTGFELSNPVVTTNAATNVTDTGATLNGSLNQKSETTTLYFDWGTSSTLSTYTRINVGETTTAGIDTSTALTGLSTGTTYYFRIVGVGQSGLMDTGTILNFRAGQTLVTTVAASDITFTRATLNGQYSDIRNAEATYKFYYGTTSAIDSTTTNSVNVGTRNLNSATAADTSTVLTGLSAGTTYYFRIIAFLTSSGAQISQGDVLSFTTGSVTSSAATSITQTSATINGSFLFGDDSATASVVGFVWGTSSSLTTDSTTVTADESPLTGDGSLSKGITGLTAGTTYYFRAYAVDDLETITATILSFTTTAASSSSSPAPSGPSTPPVVITWPTPGPITYPTPLSGTQLNAVATCNGAPVTGTYVYTPALGSILDPGTYTLLVTFVPSSGSACGSASTTVRIVVNAPSRTITWPNPPTAQGPATLGPNQLNAVCSVPGTLTYTPPAGTVLPVGTYTLSVTCTPTDPKIAPISTTVPFTVVTELAKITWPTPAPQEGPLRLGAAQLNAKCSVPGRLVYDPTLGTVLDPGTYTLKVTCIPNDPKIPAVSTTVVLVVEGPLAAPKNAVTGPNTFTQGYIKWDPVKNATGYSVDIRGEVVCKTTTATTCTVQKTIGPKTPVIVTALGKDKKTASAKAVYFNDKLLTAIEVNFATNSYFLNDKANKEIKRVSAIIKREGFTIVEITGHTDPRGGALNVPLSNNRSEALKKAMLKLVPYLEITNAGLSYDDPKVSNATKAGMAANRRSVGAVK